MSVRELGLVFVGGDVVLLPIPAVSFSSWVLGHTQCACVCVGGPKCWGSVWVGSWDWLFSVHQSGFIVANHGPLLSFLFSHKGSLLVKDTRLPHFGVCGEKC